MPCELSARRAGLKHPFNAPLEVAEERGVRDRSVLARSDNKRPHRDFCACRIDRRAVSPPRRPSPTSDWDSAGRRPRKSFPFPPRSCPAPVATTHRNIVITRGLPVLAVGRYLVWLAGFGRPPVRPLVRRRSGARSIPSAIADDRRDEPSHTDAHPAAAHFSPKRRRALLPLPAHPRLSSIFSLSEATSSRRINSSSSPPRQS